MRQKSATVKVGTDRAAGDVASHTGVMSAVDGPARYVREAFGARGDAWPLSGGQGIAWAVGDLVLKPDADVRQQEWHGTMLNPLRRCGFRLADAVATRNGRWVCDGWSATRAVEGEEPSHHASPRWAEIIEAGRALHRATASLPRPDFIGTRDTWWETADRQTWSTTSPDVLPLLQTVSERPRRALTSLGMDQVVHCDLTGNVLFANGMAPAIIDISPYWRPPAYAEGVVVADALCWHDAPASLTDDLGVPRSAVARALLFRLLTTNTRAASGVDVEGVRDEARRYELAADAIGV